MPSSIPLVSANLSTPFLASLFYGAFLVLFCASLYVLVIHSPIEGQRSKFSKPLVISSLCICLTITGHWICTCIMLFKAFVTFDNGHSPSGFYADLSQPTQVIKSVFVCLTLIIGDTVMIYRLSVIWSFRKSIIIFPICTLFAYIACFIGITYELTRSTFSEHILSTAVGELITSSSALTLCTNVYCSALITWCIWKNDNAVRHYGGRNLSVSLIHVIPSPLYSHYPPKYSWTLFFMITYISGSNLQFPAVDASPAVVGIAFMLINIRVGLGWSDEQHEVPSTNIYSIGANRLEGLQSRRPLSVHITRVIDNGVDGTFESIEDKYRSQE
ncbi:hypothetical protein BDQ12DRAFT_614878 [Crucibulum laeve]|uniref:Uncharacterized protein n=1 Tax=Crucibulum laeve TaxID=68775 RepID=A0A5C3LLT6_9AGAR|nr:hypothetical protein BDQ12DRAFT_614878 [Crucibulum laeve]